MFSMCNMWMWSCIWVNLLLLVAPSDRRELVSPAQYTQSLPCMLNLFIFTLVKNWSLWSREAGLKATIASQQFVIIYCNSNLEQHLWAYFESHKSCSAEKIPVKILPLVLVNLLFPCSRIMPISRFFSHLEFLGIVVMVLGVEAWVLVP